MEATKERRERAEAEGGDTVQLPTETSPYVRYDGLEDYKMRGYGARGHLPVSDVPHGGSGTDAPTVPGTAVPVAKPTRGAQPPQRGPGAGGAAAAAGGGGGDDPGRRGDTAATEAINRQGVP